MEIKINGKSEEIEQQTNLLELVNQRGLESNKIVIEHNATIVSKEKWGATLVSEKDSIEIISFVGGG
ncbi:MAG: sulfur carrier protein ThiS [Candidatus Aceula meridiana]|nr:sulfur carrier protein ThiS [Candidatus Aceula meridiana]